ncbi:MAG: protein kinase [Deltaproteobacteria bacterium]|nr:protein kinase [Deltaproteobacteria bacterium]
MHAHELGLVHRDFKPENVMIAEDGRVLVVDFGLARHRSGTQLESPNSQALVLWQPPVVAGTPEYMAPEARVGRADAYSDQYSFAISLHEALVGSLPPLTATGIAYVEVERFPAAIGRVLTRALAFTAEQRYSSMRELLAELPAQWAEQWRWTKLDDEVVAKPWPKWPVVVGLGLVVVAAGVYFGGKALLERKTYEPTSRPTSANESASLVETTDECPVGAISGNWKIRSTILWDYTTRSVDGRWYDLDLVHREGCRWTGHLRKWLGSENSIDVSGPVAVRRLADGRFEVEGTWSFDHGGWQTMVFTFEVDGNRLRGDYEQRGDDGHVSTVGAIDGVRGAGTRTPSKTGGHCPVARSAACFAPVISQHANAWPSSAPMLQLRSSTAAHPATTRYRPAPRTRSPPSGHPARGARSSTGKCAARPATRSPGVGRSASASTRAPASAGS